MSLTLLQQAILCEFPGNPYPGDRAIMDCLCSECVSQLAPLRGKSWQHVAIMDLYSESGPRWGKAFNYYFPALLLGLASSSDQPRWDDGVRDMIESLETTPEIAVKEGDSAAMTHALQQQGQKRRERNSRFLSVWSYPQRRIIADVAEWIRPRTRMVSFVRIDHMIENILSGQLNPYPEAADNLWGSLWMQAMGGGCEVV